MAKFVSKRSCCYPNFITYEIDLCNVTEEISLGEEYVATEEEYLSGNEDERIPDDDYPAQFEMTVENGTAQYDNFSGILSIKYIF